MLSKSRSKVGATRGCKAVLKLCIWKCSHLSMTFCTVLLRLLGSQTWSSIDFVCRILVLFWVMFDVDGWERSLAPVSVKSCKTKRDMNFSLVGSWLLQRTNMWSAGTRRGVRGQMFSKCKQLVALYLSPVALPQGPVKKALEVQVCRWLCHELAHWMFHWGYNVVCQAQELLYTSWLKRGWENEELKGWQRIYQSCGAIIHRRMLWIYRVQFRKG